MAFGDQGAGFQNPVLNKIIVIAPVNGEGIFMYSPVVGPGNLVASIAPIGGTDSFGNVYQPGVVIYGTGGSFAQLGVTGGQPFITEETNAIFENAGIFLTNSINSIGGVNFLSGGLFGPESNVTKDRIIIELNSSLQDGTGSANTQFDYVDPTGSGHLYLQCSAAGLFTQAAVSGGIVPGTGTSPANPAQAEGWHPMALASGWTSLAGHAVPSYKMMTENNEVHICGFAQHAAFTGTVIITTLPVGYRPVNIQTVPNTGDATNPAGQIAILTSGVVETSVFPTASSTQVSFNGTFPINV